MGSGDLGGLVATLDGPAGYRPGTQIPLTLTIRNEGAEPRVLPTTETVIGPDGQSASRRMVVLSLAGGPRPGPGLVADRYQLSFQVPAGEHDLYISPGKAVKLSLSFSTRQLPSAFKRHRLQAIYILPPGRAGGAARHLGSNSLTLSAGAAPVKRRRRVGSAKGR